MKRTQSKYVDGSDETGGSVPLWPINEVLLDSLVRKGLSDVEIGALFNVDWRAVKSLRKTYGN